MVMTARPKQFESPYHEAQKQLTFDKKFEIHLIINNGRVIPKIILESITRGLEEQIKTLAPQKEQMAKKTFVSNSPDLQMHK